MPLTPLNKVHRTFPSMFAEKMSEHVKQRTQSYKEYRYTGEDIVLEPLDDAEVSEMCDSDGEVSKNSLGHSHSRLTPEMSMLRTFNLTQGKKSTTSGSESDTSSAATTPRPSSSPSPRGLPVKLLESPRPQTTVNFVPAFGVSPRRPRQSPRTTGSLDNVDLWEEESDSESNDFDKVEGVMIDPLKTFDFSDLRRSKSPVACKRNKLSNVPHKPETEPGSRKSRPSPRDKQQNAARARAARRLKQIFPNPAVSKPAPRLHIAKPSTNIVEHKDNIKPASTAKKKLLPQRECRLAAKFPGLNVNNITKDDNGNESKHKLELPKDRKTQNNDYNLRNKQTDPNKLSQINKTNYSSSKQISSIKCSEVGSSVGQQQKVPDITNCKPELYDNNTLPTKSDFSPNSTSEEPAVSKKVKFNSFVTVREDQLNTLDFLKNSNNSAQMFKNRFLKSSHIDQQHSQYCGESDVNLMLQTIS